MAEAKHGVQTIMKCFEVANGPAIGFVADLVVWLIHCQQLVEHITIVRLLLADALVRCFVAASGIESKSIYRKANSMVPVLELELALWNYQLERLRESWDPCVPEARNHHTPMGESRNGTTD